MNTVELNAITPPAPAMERTILYFRFNPNVWSAVQQLEYDLLETNLSEHRGQSAVSSSLCRNGYWAVVATSRTGVGPDAVAYTTEYLRSIPTIDPYTITTTPDKTLHVTAMPESA